MRGNGLQAESYVAIASLDPSTADVVLEALRESGIAAYVEPTAASPTAAINLTQPVRPLERLFVDSGAEESAREILDRQLAELEELASPVPLPEAPSASAAAPAVERDEDRIWADIVAGFHADADPARDVHPWPAQEDVDEPSAKKVSTEEKPSSDDSDDSPSDAEVAAAEAISAAEANEAKREEAARAADRFIPPPPPPLPRLDPLMKAAWAGALGGPILLILSVMAAGYVPYWFAPVGVVAFVAGLLILLFRTRGGPPDDSDGAVV
ncbi:hypothetical protein [Tenggerimyces flavus]|uniref:DUF2007 domain-containing protein n=1 Tax=Tenggerimyces flavus TaxID=1708749 RepID=A0ABV7Y4R8_9ACTN|nr:hypothetical protein [Tenggerimyces flavus]MBM7788651.1 hypothetical protein [Tenggerimyces flavus]